MKKVVTFEEARAAKTGTIFIDRWDDGLRFVVLSGPVALCAYIGVPVAHPLAGHSYEILPVEAHGGLTYAGEDMKELPSEMYWYGWDYAHCGDFCFYDSEDGSHAKDKRWTPSEVDGDSWLTISQFHKLVKLTETVARRALQTSNKS